MTPDCSTSSFPFQPLGRRAVEAAFDGGNVTSDAGGLLLREVEQRRGILRRLAEGFTDYRDPALIEHSVFSVVAQRVLGLCLGYEDLADHDELRKDPLLATLVGKLDPTGQDRRREADRGCPLAGKSTLNRLELVNPYTPETDRYKRIAADFPALDRLLLELFVETQATPPEALILDLDATDTALHGEQEGRFFHGYYRDYCYLPLYVTCEDFILRARLRQANIDGAFGALEEVREVMAGLRARWPEVRILLRGDSGFCREELMAWCEANGVEFLFGLAKNARLEADLAPALVEARQAFAQTGQATRRFHDFRYQTLQTWSRERRVVGKAEVLAKGDNPRFVVTSLSAEEIAARPLYEQGYCARGEMENRIKESQTDLFGDRLSCHPMPANQLRLYWSVFAYTLIHELQRLALQGTELARAYAGTVRTKLLKIGAQIRISVRRVKVSLAGACPLKAVFALAWARLRAGPAPG